MCGIFGYIGSDNNAADKVFKGLIDIEYRGYDSWGVSYFQGNSFKTVKKTGFLPSIFNFPSSSISIGHTRWATHGGVTEINAHPHLSCDNKLVLVHNGIVENYRELKKELTNHKIKSETDSEIIIHLIEDQLQDKNLKDAVSEVFNKLEGLNAIVISDGKEIVVCKKGSPLVLGKTENGYVVASDPNAILPLTKKLIFLEDGDLFSLDAGLDPEFKEIDWQYTKADLDKFPHFMLKEIYEQPQVLYNQIQSLDAAREIAEEIKAAFGTYFVGCGSASYTCLLAEYAFSKISKKHINFSIGSEFDYKEDFLTNKSLLIAVSQSGETIDVVEPVAHAKKRGVKIVALTNTLGSTLYRMADIKHLLNAGPEKAVASTKAVIAMVANILLYAYSLAGKLDLGIKVIEDSAREIENIIKRQDEIKKLADKIYNVQHIFVLGRGISYPVALEATLKIKETSYIHAEGFASGELKHGCLALVDKGTPVIVFLPNDETKAAVLANAMEVKARGAFVIGVGFENNPVFDFFFEVKDVGASSVLPHIVFAQFLGYFLAIKLGLNPDKPRNLAKSVTVK
ncbi:glutamine--fructose-6-phosphate transaminase (isomerizing) [Candidatus Daviesbacteria bacterium]|nr:glutamine--fructose-6-phosphate transaminase (isomerizing) [Candidatus Daviesbacteria bacterium]